MKSENLIHIKFQNNKPKYFGYTGLHLYSVKINEEREINVESDCEALTLYKIYYDLAIYLSNSLRPNDKSTTVETYTVFGNSKHKNLLNCNLEGQSLKIVGYLNKNDVKILDEHLESKSFKELEGFRNHFYNLNKDVQEELKILLGNQLESELHSYMKMACEFIRKCKNSNSEILLIYNP